MTIFQLIFILQNSTSTFCFCAFKTDNIIDLSIDRLPCFLIQKAVQAKVLSTNLHAKS